MEVKPATSSMEADRLLTSCSSSHGSWLHPHYFHGSDPHRNASMEGSRSHLYASSREVIHNLASVEEPIHTNVLQWETYEENIFIHTCWWDACDDM